MSVYSSPRWRKARADYISNHPRCAMQDCNAPARYLDHITPWRSFPQEQQDYAFWGEWNWQGLCPTCHSRKTATHDGGFGHVTEGHT
jgi:5-methylcytosine-specific restriction protein A